MGDKNDEHHSFNKSTPPPAYRKIRNPFDRALINKLHKPICSPGMCKIYKKKSHGSFRWDIDQVCTLVPADIVACNSQFEPTPDPALEKIAEEATDRFFSQEMVMPSPQVESSKKIKPLLPTSSDVGIQLNTLVEEQIMVTREVSAQTVLTLPPELPPELELLLQPFYTQTQDQNISGDYEISANGSLRRKLFFEEQSDMEHYDSEQTDDEIHVEPRPPSSYEAHTPVVVSPDLSQDFVAKGMKRTFGTPLKKGPSGSGKPCYRNKILDVVDFGEPCFSPIGFQTPRRTDQGSATSSSIASTSISPVTKAASSDEEKNNFTSPESETMAVCLDCVESQLHTDKKKCFCKLTPNKIKRSASLKESAPLTRKCSFSFSEKRSLSMSSLYRSRSVQKLDFSMDISIDDGSLHNQSQADSESSSPVPKEASWSMVDEASIHHLVKEELAKSKLYDLQSCSDVHSINANIDETPIRSKCKSNVRTHEISKIRAPLSQSPQNMSLDNSLDNSNNLLNLEDKKMDFNKVDLKFLTDNISQFEYTASNNTKVGNDCSTSFKKVDSGFNENTFYTNASSYYESAIKPSELTVTNLSKCNNSNNALKEISNVHWMRVDSGFKDECSSDVTQFYPEDDTSVKKFTAFHYSEVKYDEKENVASEDFDKFLIQSNKNEAMSMSDIFTDDMTFNCNFSSTPSKNKSRKTQS